MNQSLQEKARQIAIFYIFIDLLVSLLFVWYFVNQERDQSLRITSGNGGALDFSQSELIKKGCLDILCCSGKVRSNEVTKAYYQSAIIATIIFILLLDTSFNITLLVGANKKRNALIAAWLVVQGIRILSSVIAICLIVNFVIVGVENLTNSSLIDHNSTNVIGSSISEKNTTFQNEIG